MTTSPDTTSRQHDGESGARRVPRWLLGVGPLALIALLIGLFTLLNAPGITGGMGRVPEEAVAIENIRFEPGRIILAVRNEGADPVTVAQVNVSDYFAQFTQTTEEMAPLQPNTITVAYDWVQGDPYEIALITSAGGKVTADVAAAPSPEQGAQFFGLMVLLGIYVGVIPIGLGMLWLPFVRRASRTWVRGLLAFTVGLLVYLTVDATLEGLELVAGSSAFGGSLVVLLGAVVAYLALEGVEGLAVRRRRDRGDTGEPSPQMFALLIAIGIGLHNLGEGLAIGSAYAVGSLALGASLVIGFAIHNTTEGLAIVTPLARTRPRLDRLAILGLIAGAPAILGALVGASVNQPTLAAFLLGIGAGAVAQVAVKLLPLLRSDTGRVLTPVTVAGIIGGVLFMFVTGLLIVA